MAAAGAAVLWGMGNVATHAVLDTGISVAGAWICGLAATACGCWSGPAARFAWDGFFCGQLRNRHTKAAYRRAVVRFLDWLGPRQILDTAGDWVEQRYVRPGGWAFGVANREDGRTRWIDAAAI